MSRQLRQAWEVGDRRELQALERGLCILEIFMRRNVSEITIADVMAELRLPRSTSYRFVRVLKELGFLEPAERRGMFRLSSKVALLARHARPSLHLAAAARPVLERLVEQTHETAFVTVRTGGSALCIERIESPQTVRLAYEKGRMMPLHAGCSAKLLLAYSEPALQETVLAGPLQRYTEATTCEARALRKELARIRDKGFSVSVGETDPGASAVCVPVLSSEGGLIGGITVAGPSFRLSEETLLEFRRLAADAAHELAKALAGHRPVPPGEAPDAEPPSYYRESPEQGDAHGAWR